MPDFPDKTTPKGLFIRSDSYGFSIGFPGEILCFFRTITAEKSTAWRKISCGAEKLRRKNIDESLETLNYLTANAVNFIKGKGVDIRNDQDWADWCTMLGKYNYQKALDLYQPYVDAYGYRQPK